MRVNFKHDFLHRATSLTGSWWASMSVEKTSCILRKSQSFTSLYHIDFQEM